VRTFGLIGFPLGHSFSKKFFAEKFSREGITDAVYENFPVPDINDFPKLLEEQQDLRGINVTIPYKEAVMPFLDDYNDIVAATGACNCIKISSGKLIGYNTDVIGFRKSLEIQLLPHHSKALILGYGGAAKAVAYALQLLGINFTYVTRRPVGEKNGMLFNELDAATILEHTLIINTTPVGTYPNTDACPAIPYESVTPQHYLFDLIYNPEETLFLKKGKQQGAVTQNGLPMLILQAEESWNIWTAI